MVKIGIINYQMGNLGSVKRKFSLLGYDPEIVNEPSQIMRCDKLVLPGVGHFAAGMASLKKLLLFDELNEAVLIRKIPVLGICLGMQLLAGHSEEGDCDGLNWIGGRVIRFRIHDRLHHKVPHMGWNTLKIVNPHPVFDGIGTDDEFYFVHSYHVKLSDSSAALTETEYEYPFVSSIGKDHILGFQFHPEKSHETGKRLLKNFINL